MQTMTIPRRFCGPPNSGNGGYICGLLAKHIPGDAEIMMRAPTPLDTELAVVEAEPGKWELRSGDKAVLVGRSTTLELSRQERATFEEAAEAERTPVVKAHDHLLPTCFTCGPERKPGDGLRIQVGPVRGRPTVFAATWIPDPTLSASDGRIAGEFVWAALDCPTGYAITYDPASGGFDKTPILTGTMTARVNVRPRPGERCVVTAWEASREGRKRFAEAALWGEDGTLLGESRAIWIVVNRETQLGKSKT
jgi:hypothetical protein